MRRYDGPGAWAGAEAGSDRVYAGQRPDTTPPRLPPIVPNALARSLRRQRYAARIWRLGDRVLFELVDHIAVPFGRGDDVDHLLDRFARIDPEVFRWLGADRLSAPGLILDSERRPP